MSIATQFKVSDVQITGAANTKITNLSAPTADTEVSLALQTNLKAITIRARTISTVKFSFTSGESGTTFITIPPGASYSQNQLGLSSATLYVQTDIDSNTLEILEYY